MKGNALVSKYYSNYNITAYVLSVSKNTDAKTVMLSCTMKNTNNWNNCKHCIPLFIYDVIPNEFW